MNRIRSASLLTGAIALLGITIAVGAEHETSVATKSSSSAEIRSRNQTSAPTVRSPQSGEQIKWQVVASGGAKGTSANFRLSGTAGQTAIGKGMSTNFGVNQGFWQNFLSGSSYTCGDANSDGTVNISDAVYLIAYIFAGGSAPDPLLAGDANCDSTVNISDAVYLIAYIFAGGAAPCAACK